MMVADIAVRDCRKPTFLPAALAAIAVEAGMILALAAGLRFHPQPPQPTAKPIELTMPVLAPKPPKPAPVVKPKPLEPLPPKMVRPQIVPPKVELPPIASPKTYATPDPAPVVAAPRLTPPPVAHVDANAQRVFAASVKAAVQNAVQYPYAARAAHISGRARVSFSYRDGQVSDVGIAVSSGYDMLDRAALRTVETAFYPLPPADLKGKTLTFSVWVLFQQSTSY